MTETLIVAAEESAAGWLKRVGAGTDYLAIAPTLVGAELPDGVPAEFHERVARHRRIEFWIDPSPNAQLVMMMLLAEAPSEKSWLHQSAHRLGSRVPDRDFLRTLALRHVEAADQARAAQIWAAYKAPTPEGIPPLLASDPSRFPYLRDALLALLDELPSVQDGLGATERGMLRKLADHDRLPADLLVPGETLGYWQLGAMLDDLCDCARPAIAGLEEGPFSLEMHDDPERYQHYFESRLSLTEFGQALLDGKEDFTRHNRIERQWGGTALRNGALWRWDGSQLSNTP